MDHPLDRPVWTALASGWAHLAQGGAQARRLDPRHGPFAAAQADSSLLTALIPDEGELWLAERAPIMAPTDARVLREAVLAQMIADAPPPPDRPEAPHLLLGDADAADMQALAALTKPGPFAPLTHRLGRFVGIREGGVLVAMAGERMRMPGFTEVSGVCTHPDHRGRGHAGALMRIVMAGMRTRGETPFLHSYASNAGAIALYESLGFRIRAEINMMVIAR